MVDKNDIVTTIPSSTSITAVADGEVVSAAIENDNNQKLLQIATLLYQFVRDDCPSLGVTNTFTAEQIFNILKAQQIQPATTNGDLTLNPNGTGAVRYSDGSTDTEVASKGYVQGVAFVAGNVPSGGTAGNWLEGDGTWSNPRMVTTEIAPANGSTTDLSNNVRYVVDASAGSITLRLPANVADVTTAISVMCDGANSFGDNNFTLSGNGNNIIVKNADGSYEAAATSIDINTNADFNITKSGSNYILRGGII